MHGRTASLPIAAVTLPIGSAKLGRSGKIQYRAFHFASPRKFPPNFPSRVFHHGNAFVSRVLCEPTTTTTTTPLLVLAFPEFLVNFDQRRSRYTFRATRLDATLRVGTRGNRACDYLPSRHFVRSRRTTSCIDGGTGWPRIYGESRKKSCQPPGKMQRARISGVARNIFHIVYNGCGFDSRDSLPSLKRT